MTFDSGVMLWLLAGVPVLLVLAARAARRRTVIVGSVLIWKAVAKRLSDAKKRRAILDPVALLAAGVAAFAALGAAGPAFARESDRPRVAYFADAGAAGLLTTPDGTSVQSFSALHLHAGYNNHRFNPRTLTDADAVMAWAEGCPDATAKLLFSAQDFGVLPPDVRQVTLGADPTSLPFETLAVEGDWLFARATRKGVTWTLAEVDGRQISSGTSGGPDGRSMMVALPNGERSLELRLDGAKPERDRAYLYARPALRLFISGVDVALVRALAAAFKPGAQRSSQAQDADFAVIAGNVADELRCPRLRIAGANESERIADAGSMAVVRAAQSAMLAACPPQMLGAAGMTTALTTHDADGEVLLGLTDGKGRTWPVIVKYAERGEVVITQELAGWPRGADLLPLLIAGACEELTGRNPLTDARYAVQTDVAPDALPLYSLLWRTTPQAGLYYDGVVNLVAPPPHMVITRDMPLVSSLDGTATERAVYGWLGFGPAFACLAMAMALVMRERRAARIPA